MEFDDKGTDNGLPIIPIATLVAVIFALIFAVLAYMNSSTASHNTGNLNATIRSQILNVLSPVVAQMNASIYNSVITDSLLGTRLNNVSSSVGGLNQSIFDKLGTLSTQISGGFGSVNSNISTVNSKVNSTASLISSIPSSLDNVSNAILQSVSGNRREILNDSNYTIPANSYYYGTMYDKFANHINFTANESVVMDILTYTQFANLATNRSFSAVETLTGSSQSFWYNDSEGCSAYVYVITGSSSAFIIRMNDTIVYAPSNTPTGVC